jgi:hypothetical protein
MKPSLLTLLLGVCLCAGTAQAGGPTLNFDRYHSPAEISQALKDLARSHAQWTELEELAGAAGGGRVFVLYVGPEAGSRNKRLPAVLVVANLDGTVPIASEAALFLARLLIEKAESRRDTGWYIVPQGNPDAAGRFFAKPLFRDGRNLRPHNDDMDDRTDEDGVEDLDGDGVIATMRVRDPEGEWLPVAGEPRLLKKAEAARGEKGVYALYSEGLDNDGDGRYNEDGSGGVDIGVNFPHLFRFFTSSGGPWAGSEEESLSLIRFACQHREIAMTVTFGDSNFCLAPPRSGRKDEADYTKIKIPKYMGSFLNVDTDRTYTMDEVMEQARAIVPPGFELTESMVASFLGLGQVVNPLPDDLAYYKELADQYKQFLKRSKLDGARREAPDARDGSFELWSYYQLGLPTFSMDFWTPPEVKKEEKAEASITPEKLESMSNEEFIALGEEKIGALLKSAGAPADFKAEMVINALKGGMLTTKKMAEMMRQAPKPKESSGGDEDEKALLAFCDKEMPGKGFIPWKAYKHPTLGEVEIGGFVPYAANTPPAPMLQGLLQGQVPWVLELAGKLPRLRLAKVACEPLGGGVFRVKAWVENAGYLPFPTAMGARNERPAPAMLLLAGNGLALIEGLQRTPVKEMRGGRAKLFSWIVRGQQGLKVQLALSHPSGWDDAKTIVLGEVK